MGEPSHEKLNTGKAGNLKQPKVSVIVPVYNVEKYLRQCLDSIASQTLADIEIIMMDDGSTDKSFELLKEYSMGDKRFRVLSHANRGVGPTRNRGIDEATGEYLAFVDSDDFLDCDMLRCLYERAKSENADIVVGEVFTCDEQGNNCELRKDLNGIDPVELKAENTEYFYREYYFKKYYSHNAWDKLYRAKMVAENNIKFGDNKRIFAEDNWFQLQAFQASPKISFVSAPCYYYRQQQNSIMHKPKPDLARRHSNMIADYIELIAQHGSNLIDKKVCAHVAIDVISMQALDLHNSGGNWASYKTAVKDIYGNTILMEQIKNFGKLKAYTLETNRWRKLFLAVMSNLYRANLYAFAHAIAWQIYSRKNAKRG